MEHLTNNDTALAMDRPLHLSYDMNGNHGGNDLVDAMTREQVVHGVAEAVALSGNLASMDILERTTTEGGDGSLLHDDGSLGWNVMAAMSCSYARYRFKHNLLSHNTPMESVTTTTM